MQLLTNYLTITGFAKKLGRTRQIIHDSINSGDIVPDEIGEEKIPMINWVKYSSVKLPKSRGSYNVKKKTNEKKTTA